jgi:(p)ppGpp synthase/HD superfamily hydrolase
MLFAAEQHVGQTRKGSGIPYFWHLVDVAVTLVWVEQDSEVVAAGFLHDTREDCGVSSEQLANLFGRRVATLVDEVTDVSSRADGNRARRQEIERNHLAAASPDGKTLKLADSLCNLATIGIDAPKFAPTYWAEKRLLIPHLKGGHPVLYDLAWEAACRHEPFSSGKGVAVESQRSGTSRD